MVSSSASVAAAQTCRDGLGHGNVMGNLTAYAYAPGSAKTRRASGTGDGCHEVGVRVVI
jgi:hypothetical protein